ncbi:hypothetical protein EON67_11935 [archaeon]|nr:MAG: hypothetical protein EON67_11935 [archaeon]
MPDYVPELIEHERELRAELERVEADIAEAEEAYLCTYPTANVLLGWDGLVEGSKQERGHKSERLFSGMCCVPSVCARAHAR